MLKTFMMTGNKSCRWAFHVNSWTPIESEWLLASTCVQKEEKEKIGKFVFKKDAKPSMIGRLMIRKYINDFFNIPYNHIELSRDINGKPILDNNDNNIMFNISHQGDFVVLAGEYGNIKLGIDVMKMEYSGGKEINDFFRIMKSNFSNEEWSTIRSSPNELNMFFRLWTLKESYVKAIGTGITIDLSKISFKIKTSTLSENCITNDTALYINGKLENNWQFQETLLDHSHCVSVALNYHQTSYINYTFLSFNDLVDKAKPLLTKDETYVKEFFSKPEKPTF